MSAHDDVLGRTEGLPLAEEQRTELVARQSRLDAARDALDAAQRDRDGYFVELDDAGVALDETARALGLLRTSVAHVVTEHRRSEVAQRFASEVPRAAARTALDRAQERVDRAWADPAG